MKLSPVGELNLRYYINREDKLNVQTYSFISNLLNEVEHFVLRVSGVEKDLIDSLLDLVSKQEEIFIGLSGLDDNGVYSQIQYTNHSFYEPYIGSNLNWLMFAGGFSPEFIQEIERQYKDIVKNIGKLGFKHGNAHRGNVNLSLIVNYRCTESLIYDPTLLLDLPDKAIVYPWVRIRDWYKLERLYK